MYLTNRCLNADSISLALFICGLSEGEEPALQGLATSLIDRAYHARLFTSVAVLEISAKLIGGPMNGKLFSIGKKDGQGSQGLCFSVAAVRDFLTGNSHSSPRLMDISRVFCSYLWS